MRRMPALWLLATLVSCAATNQAGAEVKAKLVQSKVIWDRAPNNADTDLVRFKNRWYCVCWQGERANSSKGVLRVITSADGAKWESAAVINCDFPMRGRQDPRLVVTPKGRLMLIANSSVPGTTLQAMAWFSKNGRDWKEPKRIRESNYRITSVRWHQGTAYSYCYGCICGIAQTVQIRTSKKGKRFNKHFEETFSGFFPGDASLLFNGEFGYCLMNRSGAGYIGRAKAPYDDWSWNDLKRPISHPNTIRLPGGEIIASVGLYDRKKRTSLCLFDPENGQLQELLTLPTGGSAVTAGLAVHDGHLWVSYQAESKGKLCVHLAKVKIVSR